MVLPSFSGIEPPIRKTLFAFAASPKTLVVSPGISSQYSEKYLTP